MAKKLYEESNIYDIACALREKCGDNSAKYKTCDMANAIRNLPTTGGGNGVVLRGNARYGCQYNVWNQNIEAGLITTEGLTNVSYLFAHSSELTRIPFDLNFDNSEPVDMSMMFNSCWALTEIPKFNNYPTPKNISNMFYCAGGFREFPEDFIGWFDWSQALTTRLNPGSFIYYCCSLREFPVEILNCMNIYPSFYATAALNELVNAPVIPNLLSENIVFSYSHRLKNLTFETDSGQPIVADWSGVTIALDRMVGYGQEVSETAYASGYNLILDFNSGITEDKEVYDAASYEALKNDPDWFSYDINYSRYNHDSAVATINSLPDTSAYLATTGKTNTIKFKGAAGALTDGGAINTLTETEIAVATAKGWTIAFA